MLVSWPLSIIWQWQKFCCNYFDFKPQDDWTKLTVLVGGVCLRSRKIFSALFSRNNFFTRSGHFTCKELQVKGNLFDCSQILTVPSFTNMQQTYVSEFFISKYFFFKSDFCTINPHLILFQKCSVTFHWNWIWQIADTFFERFGPGNGGTL